MTRSKVFIANQCDRRWFPLTVASLLCNLTWSNPGLTSPGHSPSSPAHHHEMPAVPMQQGEGTHRHSGMEVPAGQPIPTVALVVHPDAMQGWNLEVKVTNFRFAPERVNTKSLPTEGHAHLYVNGKKVARLYGSWYHLSSLPPGQHTLVVGLNANGHEQLTHQGNPIAATTIIQVPADR